MVADAVTCANAQATSANGFAEAVAGYQETAVGDWAGNAETNTLADIGAGVTLAQDVGEAADTRFDAYVNAEYTVVNTLWPKAILCATSINAEIAGFDMLMDGHYKDYRSAINKALADQKTQLAAIDCTMAEDVAQAHQTAYSNGIEFSTSDAIRVAQDQMSQTAGMSLSDFSGVSDINGLEGLAVPITDGFIYVNIHEMLLMALDYTAYSNGISFPGHQMGADPYGIPGSGSMYGTFAACGMASLGGDSLTLAASASSLEAGRFTSPTSLLARGGAAVSSALGGQVALRGKPTVSSLLAQPLAGTGVGQPYLAGPNVPSDPVATFAPLSLAGSHFSYDAGGQLTTITDPLGNTTSYTYDGAGHCMSVTDANGGVTSFTYDSAGNLTGLTDSVGNTTTWVYDDAGQVVQETNALGASRYYSYNAEGALARQVDRNGRVRQFEYDSQGRVTMESWFDSTADADAWGLSQFSSDENGTVPLSGEPTNVIHYQFDDAGNLTAEWDTYSSYTYAYDSMGRQTSVTIANPGQPVVVFTEKYEGDSSLVSSVSSAIDGVPDYLRTYQYDTSGNVTRIAQTGQWGGNAVAEIQIDLTYDIVGRLVSVARYLDNQLVVTSNYAYDSLGNLVSLAHTQGSTTLASYAWSYDVCELLDESGSTSSAYSVLSTSSRVTSMTTVDGTVTYTYDSTGQLIAADCDGTQSDELYTYDGNGNRIGDGYVIGAGNQFLSDGKYWYAYDAEGNRTARYVWTDVDADGVVDFDERSQIIEYAWDPRNRLISVTDYATDRGPATQRVEYVYDIHNRWISRVVDADGDGPEGSESTSFAYDVTAAAPVVTSPEGQITQAAQIVFQFDESGSLAHRYLWSQAVDQLLADEQSSPCDSGDGQSESHVIWPLGDNLGTVRDLAQYDAATGVTRVVNHRVYDSFGNLRSQTNSAVDCLFGFAGRPFDRATGLQNNLNRWYDAKTGRWMSADPIGLAAGDANDARYCANTPTTITDPCGTWWFWSKKQPGPEKPGIPDSVKEAMKPASPGEAAREALYKERMRVLKQREKENEAERQKNIQKHAEEEKKKRDAEEKAREEAEKKAAEEAQQSLNQPSPSSQFSISPKVAEKAKEIGFWAWVAAGAGAVAAHVVNGLKTAASRASGILPLCAPPKMEMPNGGEAT